jgi:IclR family transcriptional regulator, KDG regulon repressor
MPSDQVQTLSRVVDLLDCFSLERPELGVREIARMVNLSSSTAGRLLAALKEAGILSQNPVTHAYMLGSKVLFWAGIYTNTLDVRMKALESLHDLHRETEETISLYVLDGNDRVCVERIESPHNVRIVARIGRRLPLHAGSAGKVLLAHLPFARQEEIIRSNSLTALTPHTIVNPDELRSELAKIRQDGYAISRGEWLMDASGVAAPIFDYGGGVVAAVTISGPGQRFTDEAFARYIPMILTVARQISSEMGYRLSIPSGFQERV